MTKPNVTICPPAEQDVFFQDTQFDENLGGTNPDHFLNKGSSFRQISRSSNVGVTRLKKSRLKKAEKELEGHDNREEILKILRSE